MQAKVAFIALGVIGAAVQFTLDRAQAQTALPGVTIEGAGGGTAGTESGASGGNQGQTTGGDPSTAIDGYVAESSSTGTKTNTPLREIPQSVSVVTRDQIEDRGADTLNEAIGYSAGVTVSPYGLDTRCDQFVIRGFEQNTTGVYRDGLRLPTFSFNCFRMETYGVDHIDIMRGPTSTLYGLNNPGGLINVVSKMPTEQAFGEVWASYGTHDNKQTGFDIGGPVDSSGKVLYRITGVVRDSDTQVDFVEDDRLFIAPAVTFKPSDATTHTILGTYQKDKTGDTFQLLPLEAVQSGDIPRGTFLGEPDFSKRDSEQWSVGYQFEHKFDPAWTFRQNLRYDSVNLDYRTIYPSGTLAPLGSDLLLRSVQDAEQSLGLFQVDNQVQFDSRFDRIENTLLVGVDYSHFSGESSIGFGFLANPNGTAGNIPSIIGFNPFNPTYGQFYFFTDPTPLLVSGSLPTPSALAPIQDVDQTQEQVGLYVQDQIKFDKHWVLTLSGRQDWVSTKVDNHLTGVSTSDDDSALTGRAGLAYLFDNGLTPYVSVSTSFLPVSGFAPGLEPEEAQQYEVGVKYQPKGFKSYGTVSLFDLTKQNATQVDPSDPLGINFIQIGEIQVRGIEFEGVIHLDNGWKFFGAFSHWDAEVTDDANAAIVGNRPPRIPENVASAWAYYTFQYGMLEGLSAGVGVRYVGDTFGDDDNTIKVDSYTLFDAALNYEWDGWRLSLDVANLLDEEYAGTCGTVTSPSPGVIGDYDYCSYGEGRTATVKLSYRW